MTTTNCNIKKDPTFEVYCGRGQGFHWYPQNCTSKDKGVFGNPVAIGKNCPVCNSVHQEGGSTLPCYEQYLVFRLNNDYDFNVAFYQLKGKKLGCFCKPAPCHTDIMIKYLEVNHDGLSPNVPDEFAE